MGMELLRRIKEDVEREWVEMLEEEMRNRETNKKWDEEAAVETLEKEKKVGRLFSLFFLLP